MHEIAAMKATKITTSI